MHWYLVHTKPKQEQRALLNLSQQGYACYLPMMPTEKLQAGSLRCSEEPLFARYLFVNVDPNAGRGLTPVHSTMGVSRLVTFGAKPAKVSDELVQSLRHAANEIAAQPARLYEAGERVLIASGPFKGLDAVFQMHDGAMRAMVLIQMLSRPAQVEVPLASLRRVR